MSNNIYKNFFAFIVSLFFTAICFASPPATVWRADSRGPDIIFQQGFNSYGTNLDFIQHIIGESCTVENSAFISTTTNQDMARSWARRHLDNTRPALPYFYIYQIRATNNFYGSVVTLDHLANTPHLQSAFGLGFARRIAAGQSEYNALFRIDPQQIIGVNIVNLNQQGMIVSNYQANPGYVPANTQANAGPFTGSDNFPPETLSSPMLTSTPPETACFLSPDELAEHPRFEPFLLYMLNNVLD